MIGPSMVPIPPMTTMKMIGAVHNAEMTLPFSSIVT